MHDLIRMALAFVGGGVLTLAAGPGAWELSRWWHTGRMGRP